MAWGHAKVPHRAICKKLRYVAEATDLPNKPNNDDQSAFEDMCARKDIDEKILVEISRHLSALMDEMSVVTADGSNPWDALR